MIICLIYGKIHNGIFLAMSWLYITNEGLLILKADKFAIYTYKLL